MASTDPIVAALKKEVFNTVTPNLCHGTIPLESNEGALFYKTERGSEARYIAPRLHEEWIFSDTIVFSGA